MVEEAAADRAEIAPLNIALYGRSWDSFPLHQDLLRVLRARGFVRTTVVQDLFLSAALKGRDVLLKARRGSGKALAYLLLALDRVLRRKEDASWALVVVPDEARALALAHLAEELARDLSLRVSPFAAEERIPEDQFRAVEKGVDLLITTPYWLNRALKWRLVPLATLRLAVFDEFEAMLSRSRGLVEGLLRRLPPPGRRQAVVILEEPHYEALELAHGFLDHPEELYLEAGREDFSSLELGLVHVAKEEKLPLLLGLMARRGWPKTLVFLNQKAEAQSLCDELKRLGLKAVFLKPDLGPEFRLRFLKQFAGREADILVATDAGCRFVQQADADLLVNYDLPETVDEFRLRASRVKEGGALVSFCDEEGAFFLEGIEKELGFRIPVLWPEPEEEWFLSPEEVRERFAPRGQGRPARRPRRRPPSRGGRRRTGSRA